MELRHEGAGVRVIAQAQLKVATPRLELKLSIHGGNISSKVVLHNAGSLKFAFDAAAGEEFDGNVQWYAPAGSLSIPISGLPFSIDLRNEIWVDTVFSAKQSSFNAGGEYGLNADAGFTSEGKNFTLVGPKGFSVKYSAIDNLNGFSAGAQGLNIRDQVTITGGLGMAGFTVGPMLALGTSFAVSQGASEGIVQCKGAALAMFVAGGVGYTIPRPIAQFINAVFSLIHVQPVKDHDGVMTDWKNLFAVYSADRDLVCGEAPKS